MMAALKIVELGEPVLRQQCRKVTVINKKIKKLLDGMRETMYRSNGRISRSSGWSPKDRSSGCGKSVTELINPEIVFQEGKDGGEGCLSILVAGGVARRPESVRALDLQMTTGNYC